MLKEDFDLAAEAFSLKPDPRVVFSHAAFRKVCADILVSHLSQRQGLVLVTGETGVGKSTLLLKLLADRQIAQSCVYLSCQSRPPPEVLVDWWCARLGISEDADAPEARSRVLVAWLTQHLERGGSSALLLDDAENLDEACLVALRDLAELERDGRPLVQIILAGQTQNGNGLQKKPAAIAFPTRLEPISPLEIGGYILCRLSSAGYQGPALFSTDAIQWIARATQGNPRLVNGLCQAAISLAAAKSEPTISAVTVEQALQETPAAERDAMAEAGKAALPVTDAAASVEPGPATAGRSTSRPETSWPLPLTSPPEAGERTQHAVSADRSPGGASPWHQGVRFAAGILVGLALGVTGLFVLEAHYGLGAKISFDLLSAADRQKLDPAAAPSRQAVSKAAPEDPIVRKIVVVEQTAEGVYIQTTERPAEATGIEVTPSPPLEDEGGVGHWFRRLLARLMPQSEDQARGGQRPER